MSAEQVTTVQVRPAAPHPLDQLSVAESDVARQGVLEARGAEVALNFRSIALEEPPKEELINFLELEHAGSLTAPTARPARLAKVQYDVVRGDRSHEYTESLIDVHSGREVSQRVVDKIYQAALTT
jgi:primary-amine oxidase